MGSGFQRNEEIPSLKEMQLEAMLAHITKMLKLLEDMEGYDKGGLNRQYELWSDLDAATDKIRLILRDL